MVSVDIICMDNTRIDISCSGGKWGGLRVYSTTIGWEEMGEMQISPIRNLYCVPINHY